MMNQPPPPQAIWDTLSPDAQAAVTAPVQSFERRIADLEERLGKNSTNPSEPPSSDPPSVKRRPPAPATGCKRGALPGHRHRSRSLVPPAGVRHLIECKPPACPPLTPPLRAGQSSNLIGHQAATRALNGYVFRGDRSPC